MFFRSSPDFARTISLNGVFFGFALLIIFVIISVVKGIRDGINNKRKEKEAVHQEEVAIRKAEQEKIGIINKEISKKVGLSKFELMEQYEVAEENKKRREDQRKAAEAMRTLGMATATSVYQEKENDWALHAGMATAIGGLGAGLASSMQTAAEN